MICDIDNIDDQCYCFSHIQSTLLQCLLGELPLVRGEINMKGSVAYAGQEPWIFSASVRENILFGKPYQMDWYNTVVDVCALNKVKNSYVLLFC